MNANTSEFFHAGTGIEIDCGWLDGFGFGMRLSLRCFAVLAAVAGMFAVKVTAEPKPKPFVPDFKFSVPLNATLLAANRAGLLVEGFAAPASRPELQSGDTITALVSLIEDKALTQWLVQLRAADLTEKEKQMPPLPDWRLYTSTGQEFNFAGKRAALEIRMVGPLKSWATNDEKAVRAAKDQKVRILVNSEHLQLGFDRACAAWARTDAALAHKGSKAQPSWRMNTQRFTPEQLVQGKTDGQLLGMTVEEERAMAGSFPALLEFFSITLQTSELKDVLMEVADIPWWQLIKHGGQPEINVNYLSPFGRGEAKTWQLSADESVWFMPLRFELFGKPVLACRLAVTAPKPPLLTSAGIVGVAAQRPDGKGPHLMIQIMATRCAQENLEKICVK
jgi:hypothetical protein